MEDRPWWFFFVGTGFTVAIRDFLSQNPTVGELSWEWLWGFMASFWIGIVLGIGAWVITEVIYRVVMRLRRQVS